MSEGKIQYTLVIIKPDALVKSLTGNILARLSETKLRIIAAKVVKVTRELAEEHYKHLLDKPFFEDIYQYFSGKLYGSDYERVIAFVYEGENAIEKVRKIVGATNPLRADPNTIRGAYGRVTEKGIIENLIHCSESEEAAEKEIKMWFKPDEIIKEIYPVKVTIKNNVEVKEWA